MCPFIYFHSESSVGVEHTVEYDHVLSTTDLASVAAALNSALEDHGGLIVGNKTFQSAGTPQMLFADETRKVLLLLYLFPVAMILTPNCIYCKKFRSDQLVVRDSLNGWSNMVLCSIIQIQMAVRPTCSRGLIVLRCSNIY